MQDEVISRDVRTLFAVLAILCEQLTTIKREILSQLYAPIHSVCRSPTLCAQSLRGTFDLRA